MNKGKRIWIENGIRKTIKRCRRGEIIELELEEPEIILQILWELKQSEKILDYYLINHRNSVKVATKKREVKTQLTLKYKESMIDNYQGILKQYYIFEDKFGRKYRTPMKKFLGKKLSKEYLVDCKVCDRKIIWIYHIEEVS